MRSVRVDRSNEDQLVYWGGRSGEYWADRADRFDEGVADYDFVAAAGIQRGDRVLDVGCGSGATTRAAAALGREAVGVDLSAPMLALARTRSAGIPNVSYEQADAQVHAFAEFDVVISRNGVMFFGDPEAAFHNLAAALRPGGRVVLMTWQPVARNEWIRTIREALGSQTPERPGFNDPDWIRTLLTSTGFRDIRVEPRAADMYLGKNADDALEFITGQFEEAFTRHPNREEATAALRADFAAHETPRGVRYGSAAWLTQARKP